MPIATKMTLNQTQYKLMVSKGYSTWQNFIVAYQDASNQLELASSAQRSECQKRLDQLKAVYNEIMVVGTIASPQAPPLRRFSSNLSPRTRQLVGGFQVPNTGAGAAATPESSAPPRSMSHRESSGSPVSLQRSLSSEITEQASMPECAEKSLELLCNHFGGEDRLAEAEVSETYNTLKAQIETENLSSVEVSAILAEIDGLLSTPDDDSLFSQFNELRKDIRPLDMAHMLLLMPSSEASVGCIQNKDIILLLGETGAGKSTTIHWLSGSDMHRTIKDELDHIEPVSVNQGFEAFTMSPTSDSETKRLSAVEIQVRLSLSESSPGTPIVLCDTPGFGDTEGPEEDIANGKGVVRAIRFARSVRPLVLITESHLKGSKMKSFLNLLKTIEKLITTFDIGLPSITYAFTKFSPREAEQISTRIILFKKSLKAKKVPVNLRLIKIIDDIIFKISERVWCINPLFDRPEALLQKILEGPSITSPGEVFRDFVTADSMSKLNDQLSKHDASITNARDTENFGLLAYKLGQLKSLTLLLPIPGVLTVYQRSVEAIKSFVRRCLQEAVRELNLYYVSSFDGSPTRETFKKTLSSLCMLASMEPIRSLHFPDMLMSTGRPSSLHFSDMSDLSDCLQLVISVQNQLLQTIDSLVPKNLETHIADFFSNSELLSRSCWKMLLILEEAEAKGGAYSAIIPDLGARYAQAKGYVNRCFEFCQERVLLAIESRDTKQFIGYMGYVNIIFDKFNLDNTATWAGQFDDFKLKFSKNLFKSAAVAQQNCERESVSSDDIQQLCDVLFRLDEARGQPGIDSYLEMERLEAIYNTLFALGENRFTMFCEQIRVELSQASINYAQVANYIKMLNILNRGVAFSEQITAAYVETDNLITTHITQLSTAIISEASKINLMNGANDFNVKVFTQQFEQMLQVRKLLGRSIAFQTCAHVEQLISDHLNALQRLIESSHFTIQELSQIRHCNDYLRRQKSLFSVAQGSGLTDIQKIYTKLQRELSYKIMATAESIVGIDLESDWAKLDEISRYIKACETLQNGDVKRALNALRARLSEKVKIYIAQLTQAVEKPLIPFLKIDGTARLIEQDLVMRVQPLLERLKDQSKFYKRSNLQAAPYALKERFYHDFFRGNCTILARLSNMAPDYIQHQSRLLDAAPVMADLYRTGSCLRGLRFLDKYLLLEVSFSKLLESFDITINRLNDNAINQLNLAIQSRQYAEFNSAYTKLTVTDPAIAENLSRLILALNNAFIGDIRILSETINRPAQRSLPERVALLDRLLSVEADFICLSNHINSDNTQTCAASLAACHQSLFISIDDTVTDTLARCFERYQYLEVEALCDQMAELSTRYKPVIHYEGGNPLCDALITSHARSNVHFVRRRKFIRQRIEANLIHTIEHYQTIESGDFNRYRPNIVFEGLFNAGSKVISTPLIVEEKERTTYESLYCALGEVILANIKAQLIACKAQGCIDFITAKIEAITNWGQYLPESIYTQVVTIVQPYRKHNNAAIMERAIKIKSCVDGANILALVVKLSEAVRVENHNHSQFLITTIEGVIHTLVANFNTELQNQNLLRVLDRLKDFWFQFSRYNDVLRAAMLDDEDVTRPNYRVTIDDAYFKGLFQTVANAVCGVANTFSDLPSEHNLDDLPYITTHYKSLVSFLALETGSSSLFDRLCREDERRRDVKRAVIDGLNGLERYMHVLTLESVDRRLNQFELSNIKLFLAEVNRYQTEISNIYTDIMLPTGQGAIEWISYAGIAWLFYNVISEKVLGIKSPLLNIHTNTQNGSDRDTFIQKQYAKYRVLIKAQPIIADVCAGKDISKFTKASIDEYFILQLNVIKQKAQDFIILFSNSSLTVQNLKELNILIDLLDAFRQLFLELNLSEYANRCLDNLKNKFKQSVRALANDAYGSNLAARGQVVKNLIQLKMIEFYTSGELSEYTYSIIDGTLNKLSLYSRGRTPDQTDKVSIIMLGATLNGYTEKPIMAKALISQHKVFAYALVNDRNTKTFLFGIDHVLKKVITSGSTRDHTFLKSAYEYFQTTYNREVLAALHMDLTDARPYFRGEIRKAIEKYRVDKTHTPTLGKYRQLIELIAYIFAAWTYLYAKEHDYLNVDPGVVSRDLLQPHPAQVVAVFCMLGMDSTLEKNWWFLPRPGAQDLKNHLVEVLTGEGKSVVLAVTAIVFSLAGYEVDCACYSKILSERDRLSFKELFKYCGVEKPITYGTFNDLCEKFIHSRGDTRALLPPKLREGKKTASKASESKEKKVLLIDEVDVFFTPDFFGNHYRPLVEFQDPVISNLIDYIWKNRKDRACLSLDRIKESDVYKACLEKFNAWAPLLEECLKHLLMDVKRIEAHKYVVKNGKIGYLEHGNLVFNLNVGYKTLFAYYIESEGRFSTQQVKDNLRQKKGLLIDCGVFSYINVAQEYKHIMGVTGTLQSIDEWKMPVLSRTFNIKDMTYIPSAYGEGRLQFFEDTDADVMIRSRGLYHPAIRDQITQRLQHRTSGNANARAVLVFFETTEILTDFYQSDYCKARFPDARVITPLTSQSDRESHTRQAATPGSVTLLTAEYGRGTDFISYSDDLIRAGGVHVLQTFFSKSKSEELQMKGRAARQGQDGSYGLVLLGESLEYFNLYAPDIDKARADNKIYAMLDKKREALCLERPRVFDANSIEARALKEDHNLAVNFQKKIAKNGSLKQKQLEFLVSRNRVLYSETTCYRTICLIDGTRSMSHLFRHAKDTAKKWFNDALKTIQLSQKDVALEVQFVFYRNYDSGARNLLSVSPWLSDPESAFEFIDGQSVNDGWINEAIEIGLWHVNQEHQKCRVDHVVLIGDMPPNTKKEVSYKRDDKGEEYWKDTDFRVPTHYKVELEKLKASGVPVHPFYVEHHYKDKPAQAAFEEIAKETGGQAEFLDVKSSDGAKLLSVAVTEKILVSPELIQLYRDNFGHTAPEVPAPTASTTPIFNSMSPEAPTCGVLEHKIPD